MAAFFDAALYTYESAQARRPKAAPAARLTRDKVRKELTAADLKLGRWMHEGRSPGVRDCRENARGLLAEDDNGQLHPSARPRTTLRRRLRRRLTSGRAAETRHTSGRQ